MTLRWKTLLLMGAVLSVALLLLWVVMRGVLLSSFQATERQQVRSITSDARTTLQLRSRELERHFLDWVSRDDIYDYARTRDARFERSNLSDASIGQLDVDYIGIFDEAGRPVFSTVWNSQTNRREPVWPELNQYLKATDPLFRLPTANSINSGILNMPKGPLQTVALPLHNSDKKGARRGTIVVGSFLDRSRLARYLGNSRNHIEVVKMASLAPDLQRRLRQNEPQPEAATADGLRDATVVVPLDANRVAGYQVLRGFYGAPRWALTVTTPRDTMKQGYATAEAFGYGLLAMGVFACLLTLLPVESLVLRRVSQLSKDVQQLRLIQGRDSTRALAGPR